MAEPQQPTYFISYGTRINEYQVWNNTQIVCRSPKPETVIEFLKEEYKRLKQRPTVHAIPPTDSLEKQIHQAMDEVARG